MTKDEYMEAARLAGQLAGIFVPGGGLLGDTAARMTDLIMGEARRELDAAGAAEVEAEMSAQWASDASKTDDELDAGNPPAPADTTPGGG